MNEAEPKPPYENFEGNAGGFLVVEFPKSRLALPYIALRQIQHHEQPERIVMEFAEQNIEVHGRGLGQLFELLASLRVKTVRVGAEINGPCKVEKILPQSG